VYILAAHFRDQLIAASLKRAKAYSDRRGSRQFPRSTDRGLIEARFATPTRVGGPTHFRDQLIAASLKPSSGTLLIGCANSFPRSTDRGLIEAILRFMRIPQGSMISAIN